MCRQHGPPTRAERARDPAARVREREVEDAVAGQKLPHVLERGCRVRQVLDDVAHVDGVEGFPRQVRRLERAGLHPPRADPLTGEPGRPLGGLHAPRLPATLLGLVQ
jgi:hypothetical protein